MTRRKKYIGPPGTGKTTRIIKDLIESLRNGDHQLDQVVFCSYTNAAVDEARERIIKLDLPEMANQSPFGYRFKTMHSLCGQLIGFIPNKLIKDDARVDKTNFLTQEYNGQLFLKVVKDGEYTGPEHQITDPTTSEILVPVLFDLYHKVISNYPEEFEDVGKLTVKLRRMITPSTFPDDGPIQNVADIAEFCQKWHLYKKQIGKFEFIDLLYATWKANHTLLIVDEFQDLTRLQYLIFEQWKTHSNEVWIAGDPDQSIYGFQGGTPHFLINAFGSESEIFLSRTFRLPPNILDLTLHVLHDGYANRSRIRPLSSASNLDGTIQEMRINDLANAVESSSELSDSIFILCRTNLTVAKIRSYLDQRSIIHDTLQSDEEGKVLSSKFKSIVTCYEKIIQYLAGSKHLSKSMEGERGISFTLLELTHFLPMINKLKTRKSSVPKSSKPTNWFNGSLLKRGALGGLKKAIKQEVIHNPKFQFLLRPRQDFNFQEIIDKLFDDDVWNALAIDGAPTIEERIISQLTSEPQTKYFEMLVRGEIDADELLHPIIKVDTIHKSKGKEADTVFVITKPTIYETEEQIDLGEENRVWYVGVSRAKRYLYLVRTGKETRFLENL